MARPNFDFKLTSIDANYGQQTIIEFTYVVYTEGACRVCLDLPTNVPVFFSENDSNSFCKIIGSPSLNTETEMTISITFYSMNTNDSKYFKLIGSITDSAGNVRRDDLSITLSN